MSDAAWLLLVLLQCKHFLCDFLLQTSYQLRHKGTYGHPGGLLHAGLHTVSSAAVLGIVSAWMPLAPYLLAGVLAAEFVLHYHIDWTKEQVIRPYVKEQGTAYWAIFGFDQLLHQATYVAILWLALR
jgi:hypothetical protein